MSFLLCGERYARRVAERNSRTKKECSPPAGAPRPEGAGDPDRVVLMRDTVAKQLGLKLVLENRPIPAFGGSGARIARPSLDTRDTI